MRTHRNLSPEPLGGPVVARHVSSGGADHSRADGSRVRSPHLKCLSLPNAPFFNHTRITPGDNQRLELNHSARDNRPKNFPIIMIDLRSDTVTRPSPAMMQAILAAEVGDDVFDEDPTVHELESYAASLFGVEAAVYCPSGTMTNQIAVKVHTEPGDEVICDRLSHLYNYEGGGIMFHSGASVRLMDGDRGRFTADDVIQNINVDNVHFPRTRLVCVENTCNKGGGSIWSIDSLRAISEVARERNLRFHLDGARLFNGLTETGEDPKNYGGLFDSISICLSKGLGAPVGSLLLSSQENIYRARRFRKVMGGGMRQAGFMAAAGLYALKHHVPRLAADHARARQVGALLERLPGVQGLLPIESNIVVATLASDVNENDFLSNLEAKGIRAVPFGPQTVRFVTHLDFTDAQLDQFAEILAAMSH